MKVTTERRQIRTLRRVMTGILIALLGAPVAIPAAHGHAAADDRDRGDDDDRDGGTPIRHLVVIFQENVSFDHYFATYPNASNTDGSPFTPKLGTPLVNGLFTGGLLDHNPNAVQPFRLGHGDAATCDQDHNYPDEQKAFNAGAMNRFVETVGVGPATCFNAGKGKGLVMITTPQSPRCGTTPSILR